MFAKLQPFPAELRQLFSDPNYNSHLEQLVTRIENVEEKLAINGKLLTRWAKKSLSAEAV